MPPQPGPNRRHLSVGGEVVDCRAPGAGAVPRAVAPAGLAGPSGGLLEWLQAVLAKRREVDHQVRRVGETVCKCLLRIEHGFVI